MESDGEHRPRSQVQAHVPRHADDPGDDPEHDVAEDPDTQASSPRWHVFVEVVDHDGFVGVTIEVVVSFDLHDPADTGEAKRQQGVRVDPDDGVEDGEPTELIREAGHHPEHDGDGGQDQPGEDDDEVEPQCHPPYRGVGVDHQPSAVKVEGETRGDEDSSHGRDDAVLDHNRVFDRGRGKRPDLPLGPQPDMVAGAGSTGFIHRGAYAPVMVEESQDDAAEGTSNGESDADPTTGSGAGAAEIESLRAAVEERYDFDDFGPAQMADMSADEWEAVFDSDSWTTGTDLLDRVEQDLRAHVERRDVFAVIERDEIDTDDGRTDAVIAYSDEGYAVVYPDGSVEGRGTVVRDVKPVVALCSMPGYDPDAPTGDGTLPDPEDVGHASTELGNRVMQIVGLVQFLAGVGLFVAWIVFQLSVIVPVVAVGFLLFGTFILGLVANARLADRFRAEEYRERLRSANVGTGERPAFVPGGEDEADPAIDREDGGQ